MGSLQAGAEVRFLGAAGTVTGSKFLVCTGRARVLVDCGLFQGPKAWRLQNWEIPAALGKGIDAVVLTHAHLDHSGWLPRLAAYGPAGSAWPVYATPVTIDLCRVLLADAAHLQEEDAAYANKKGYSRHHPALPLYTVAEAEAVVRQLRPRTYGERWEAAPGIVVELQDAGHLLGSATVRLTIEGHRQLLFSGDLGRYDNPLLRDPTPPGAADVVVMESTYGGRLHSTEPPEEALAAAVRQVIHTGGCLVIPAFAVGRTQDLLYAFYRLIRSGRLPALPIFVDSPMASEATRLFLAHAEARDPQLRAQEAAQAWGSAGNVRFCRTRQESQALNDLHEPAIIIAASGMATGGRVLHHLKRRLSDPRTVVLLAGYQAPDTRGRLLLDGATHVKMHGELAPVRAAIRDYDGLSAHADQAQLLRWLDGLVGRPSRLVLAHGEPDQAAALASQITHRYGWSPVIAEYGASVTV